MTKITYVCRTCGSDDVLADAWAEWNVSTQQWVVRDITDNAECKPCGGETKLIYQPCNKGE